MSTTTQTASLISSTPTRAVATRSAIADGGPWLFLTAPASFALILAIAIYLARISF